MLKKPVRPFLLSLLRTMFPSKASAVVFVCVVVPVYVWLTLFLMRLDR